MGKRDKHLDRSKNVHVMLSPSSKAECQSLTDARMASWVDVSVKPNCTSESNLLSNMAEDGTMDLTFK